MYFETTFPVRYYETDQMGVVHHSNYIRYFECARNAMIDQGAEVLEGEDWKASWKNINSSRFDSKSFKAAHGDLYTEYTKPVTTCRFLISA